MNGAPRLPDRIWRGLTRGAGLAVALWATAASAQITDARFDEPTERYPHAVLGDAIEYGALLLTDTARGEVHFRLPQERVFEDVSPRVVDITGDGAPEVIVVESHQRKGARRVVYSANGILAATPYIGTRFRWLAPTGIGAADLDGDGQIELAYVDRPHLAKTLRVWRFEGGALREIAHLGGVTNHRIGEPHISGGIRTCGGAPEIIVADARWRDILSVTLEGNRLETKRLGSHQGGASFAQAMRCAPLE